MRRHPTFLTLLFVLTWLFSSISGQLAAAEIDKGTVIIDNIPWKISWVKSDENNWILLADFDAGELRTYFNKAPPRTGLGLDPENHPTKQEFEFFGGEKFVSTFCQYEQWEDGAKAWSFKFGNRFERNGEKVEFAVTDIIQEVGGAQDEIRYVLRRVFE